MPQYVELLNTTLSQRPDPPTPQSHAPSVDPRWRTLLGLTNLPKPKEQQRYWLWGHLEGRGGPRDDYEGSQDGQRWLQDSPRWP
eukprot:4607194-Pyramimonas_sp.AAC.1